MKESHFQQNISYDHFNLKKTQIKFKQGTCE